MTTMTLENSRDQEAREEIRWSRRLMPFATPDNRRGTIALLVTLALFVVCWALAYAAIQISLWFAPLAIIPGAFAVVRVFIMQHDCGHGALFASESANVWVGRALGVLTFTPYDVWRHAHALHHASHGNLDRRGHGDIDTKTVAEYSALSIIGKLKYRAYRHPLVMFAIGPVYMFALQHRLPVGYMNKGALPWVSAMATNLGLVAISLAIISIFGCQN